MDSQTAYLDYMHVYSICTIGRASDHHLSTRYYRTLDSDWKLMEGRGEGVREGKREGGGGESGGVYIAWTG